MRHSIYQYRRWVIATAVVVFFHFMLAFWLANSPRVVTPPSSFIVDVRLEPGSGVSAVPALDGSDARPLTQPDQPTEDAAEESENEPAKMETVEQALQPESGDKAASDPLEDAAVEVSSDVLALVEAMVGTSASEIGVSPPATNADPNVFSMPSQPGLSGGCALGEEIRLALLADPAVRAGLDRLPKNSRSVADAVQLWSGGWIPIAATDGEITLMALRRTISATVEAAPRECRDNLVQGPLFLVVANSRAEPIILVVGSDEWEWSELMTPQPSRLFRWFGLE